MATSAPRAEIWPSLPLADWADACATLHRWTQIVGKIRLAQTPWINHSWHVVLYVTARGLTTSPIPHPRGIFQIDFDFIDHQLLIRTDRGDTRVLPLQPQAVADFYDAVMTAMVDLDVPVRIHTTPCELTDAIPFEQDRTHASYSPEHAQRLWRIFAQTERVFRIFRARFIGKCSPIHFFWGSFDLAVTRFSGRTAPRHPGGVPHLPDEVAREAYSHEVSSCGFWPGGGSIDYPAFYAYAYPAPEGFAGAAVRPAQARYNGDLGEFLLPYDDVRTAANPDEVLLEFLQSTYEAAANLGKWDRGALERDRLP